MISFISGTLYKANESSVIVETGGIGYLIYLSPSSIGALGTIGADVHIFTYLSVRDDGLFLYGFVHEEELTMFGHLITVSGIGHKSAMTMLSSLSPTDIMTAIVTEDANTLSKAQGIGKKTAQRLILELKDKFKASDLLPADLSAQQSFKSASESANDAIDALLALGYTQSESVKAVMGVSQEGLKTEQILKLALKKLAQL